MNVKEVKRLIGSLFIAGFEGTTATPHVRSLIEDHYVGSILLSAKNLISASQTTQLTKDLQHIAHNAGHKQPLLIAIDQENGGVNSLFDKEYIQQFPSALAMVACDSLGLAHEVALATAKEMHSVGINWILGPVLDVLSNIKTQPLGVRSLGDDPTEVAHYGLEFIRGYHDGGVATCGKHFPSYGNLEFLGSPLDIPIVSDTIEQLRLSALIPFQKGIQASLDSMLVGACAMPNVSNGEVKYACLSEAIVNGLLRSDLGFSGVVMAECLEIESLYENLGVGQATIMGLDAGCDMFMVCNSFPNQLEAISGLKLGLDNEVVSIERIRESAERISKLKAKFTNWTTALNPAGIEGLQEVKPSHLALSQRAYETSISLVRDQGARLPLAKVGPTGRLVLLTPLVEAFCGAATKSHLGLDPSDHKSGLRIKKFLDGEETFRGLGLSIAKRWPGKVLHASYTASGIRPIHEDLISTASTVIVLTADGVRNVYQYGFTKYVVSLCKAQITTSLPNGTPCIVVAVSSPFDFIKDSHIETYVCTYDFTSIAMDSLVHFLFGDRPAVGVAPTTRVPKSAIGLSSKRPRAHQLWLVEQLDSQRDAERLRQLLDKIHHHSNSQSNNSEDDPPVFHVEASVLLVGSNEIFDAHHFVVRNSSTGALFGLCATYILKRIHAASIGCVLVDPERRKVGIGHSLYARAMKYLLAEDDINSIQFGSGIPSVFPGLSSKSVIGNESVTRWLEEDGWGMNLPGYTTRIYNVSNLQNWSAPPNLFQRLKSTQISFKPWQQPPSVPMLAHLAANTRPRASGHPLHQTTLFQQLYNYALYDRQGCSALVMEDSADGSIIGSCLLYSSHSRIASFLPTSAADIGGIAAVVVQSGSLEVLLTQSLLAIAIAQFKAKGFAGVHMQVVESTSSIEGLHEIGFGCRFEFTNIVRAVNQESHNLKRKLT